MNRKRIQVVGVGGILLGVAGCAAAGQAAGAVGPILNFAFYVAMIALPIVGAYYLSRD